MHEFIINSFDPLDIQIPNVSHVDGNIRIMLPPVNIKLIDLSMGGILGNTHIGTKGNVVSVTLTIGEKITVGKVVEMIVQILPYLKEAHQIYQDEFNKKFLLDKE